MRKVKEVELEEAIAAVKSLRGYGFLRGAKFSDVSESGQALAEADS